MANTFLAARGVDVGKSLCEHDLAPKVEAIMEAAEKAGCTVHLVTAELDGGPIVRQAAVPVLPDDAAETLAARILVEEHRLLPAAVGCILDGRWRLDGRRFVETAITAPPA